MQAGQGLRQEGYMHRLVEIVPWKSKKQTVATLLSFKVGHRAMAHVTC